MITFETDHEGFRNSQEIRQADVITLGDSFAEAGNVPEEESFSKLIGEKLGLTSRNLGRAGYSPPLELIILQKFGLSCQPKVVVWQIAESNDLDDALRYQQWTDAGRPSFFDIRAEERWQRGKAWEQRSPTYRLFDLVRRHDSKGWPYDGKFRGHDGVEHPMRFLGVPLLNFPVRKHPGWPILTEALAKGAALCQSNQIRLVVVFIPEKYRVVGPHTQMLDPTLATPDSRTFETGDNSFGGVLESFCAAQNIPYVNATAELEARAKAGEMVYLPYDTHLSPLGHQVIADLVTAKLAE
jgi:hypothetical protein